MPEGRPTRILIGEAVGKAASPVRIRGLAAEAQA